MTDDRLREYNRKRDQSRTPEPFAQRARRGVGGAQVGGLFVIQQHAARRMHWDLRLEVGGVLASWAVPKGPSLDPREKRLAVRTEDHPLEYADFEGIIPEGNYGAGAMIVWDAGTYNTTKEADVAAAIDAGKLEADFNGHKLRGRWALVRTKGEGGKSWLLLCKQPTPGIAGEIVVERPASILSGLTIEELAAGADRGLELAARAKALGAPPFVETKTALMPMLAETAPGPFTRKGWIFELKHDGIRLVAARKSPGHLQLRSRSGREMNALFPEVSNALKHLACHQFVIDSEIVALDERGASSFELMQRRMTLADTDAIANARRSVPVIAFCFDLIAVAGFDLRHLPLQTRKEMLRTLLPPVGVLRYTEDVEADGEAFFESVQEAELEGIVAKRLDAPYASGRRSRDWLKIPVHREADLAIVGYLRGQGSRRSLGSLMLAWNDGGRFVYAGNVGSGLSAGTIDALLPELERIRRPTPAFEGTAAKKGQPALAEDAVYVEPHLVACVRYAQVTSAGVLRQPRLVALRQDKSVADCDRPPAPRQWTPPAPRPPQPQPLQISNREKVFFPRDGYTKGDLLAYYERVWPHLAPYLRDRPVVLTRYPDGIDGKNFFQKNAPDFTPDWVTTYRVEDTDYFVCNDVQSLLYVINSGCIPIHVWSARCATIDHPDWAILDLDPKGAPFAAVVTIARGIHDLLRRLDVPHGLKTSGQDGVHVLIPLGGVLTHAEARSFAEVLARIVVRNHEAIATVARPLGERGGKVYVDFLQNGYGKTIVAPFSVRPRDGAPVSTPLQWRELTENLNPRQLTIRTVVDRFRRRKDPLALILEERVDVETVLAKLAADV
jgi:bifunctional non-homologous end joining protein LigD